jgi:tetratricopeptide (TPR) repeat protein
LKYEEGFALLKRSIEIEPTAFAYRALGAVAVDMGKPDEAVRFFGLAIGMSGNVAERTESTYMLAVALSRAGTTEKAKERLREVLRLDSSHRPAAELLRKLETTSDQQ